MFPFQKDRSLSKAWQTARVGASIPAYTLRSEPGTGEEACHCRDDAAAHSKLQCMGGMVCLLTELPRGSIVPPSSSRTYLHKHINLKPNTKAP